MASKANPLPSKETLIQRHADLDRRIREEQSRRYPDDLSLKRMKIEKLHLKEAIHTQ